MYKEKQFVVYRIRNIVNGHRYIGSAACGRERWNTHLCLLRNNKHTSVHLQRAFNKYSEDKFVFEVLLLCDDKPESLEYEQVLLNTKPEYNICPVARSCYGVKRSDEVREGIRERGLKRSMIAVAENPNYGTRRTGHGKFRADVRINRKLTNLGTFDTQEEAHEVAVKAKTLQLTDNDIKNHKLAIAYRRAIQNPTWGTSWDGDCAKYYARIRNDNSSGDRFGLFNTVTEAHTVAVAVKFPDGKPPDPLGILKSIN